MNTWGAQAAHAASLDSFALCASLMLLALIVLKSPREAKQRRRLNLRWRLEDLWPRTVALAGMRRTSRSRFRERIDHLLLHMLGDELDEQPEAARDNEAEPWSPERSTTNTGRRPETGPITTNGQSTGSYQSKHGLSEPQNESRSPKPAPRHAAPPG